MSQFNKELKMYAENGLRTAQDWSTLGREVEEGSKARVDALERGVTVALYARDQTRRRSPVQRQG